MAQLRHVLFCAVVAVAQLPVVGFKSPRVVVVGAVYHVFQVLFDTGDRFLKL